MERLSIMVESDLITAADMPQPYNPQLESIQLIEKKLSSYEDNLDLAKKQFETQFIRHRISEEGGDLESVAEKLGVSVKHIKKSISDTR